MSGFWKFTSNYASRVSKILEKENIALEDLLDERDTIPELLASNAKLVEYLRRPEILEKLVDYVVEDDDYQRKEIELDLQNREELERKCEISQIDNNIDNEKDAEIELETKTDKELETEKEKEEQVEENDGEQTQNKDENDDGEEEEEEEKEKEKEKEEQRKDDEVKKEPVLNMDQDNEQIKGKTVAEEEQESEQLNSEERQRLENQNEEEEDENENENEDEDNDATMEEEDDDDDDDEEEEEEEEEEETEVEQHTRRAQVAAEILSVDVWSLTDAFMESTHLLQKLWSILDKPAPLPIFTATYFMKINEHLLDMKTDEMIQFILQEPYLVERFMRHIDTPPLMDFVLKVISTDKPDSSTGVIEVLKDQSLIPSLISFLGSEVPSSIQSAAGDFLKAFITISANNAENTTIGPNELSRQLVSDPMIRMLVDMMLQGGTGLSNGVGIVIEIIRKNNSDYDPVPVVYVTVESHPPTPRDPIYLGTLVKVFAELMPKFTEMLEKEIDKTLETPFGMIEPLGFERFKICELVAELIHCSNMALLNDEKGEEIVKDRDQIRELLIQRHKELMRRAEIDSNISMDETDISKEIENLRLSNAKESQAKVTQNSIEEHNSENGGDSEEAEKNPEAEAKEEEKEEEQEHDSSKEDIERFEEDENTKSEHEQEQKDNADSAQNDGMEDITNVDEFEDNEKLLRANPVIGDKLKIALYDNNVIITILKMFFRFPWNNFLHNVVFDIVQQILNASMDIGYNKYLAIDLFDRGEITKLIVDGHNRCLDYENETGLRLGYMGHLTLIAEEVVKFTSLHVHNSTKSPIIEEAISNSDWTYYVDETLVEIRNKYNAVLGSEGEQLSEHDMNLFQKVYGSGDDDEIDEENDHDREGTNGYMDDDEPNGDEVDSDQFSRYMSQEMTNDLPDRFGSSDEESEDEDPKQRRNQVWRDDDDEQNEDEDSGVVNSEMGGHPYHEMSAGGLDDEIVDDLDVVDDDDYDDEGDEYINGNSLEKQHAHQVNEDGDEDYEDPNDDGQSYRKANHPLYQADGSLNYPIGNSIANGTTTTISDSESDSDSENEDYYNSEQEYNYLMKSPSNS